MRSLLIGLLLGSTITLPTEGGEEGQVLFQSEDEVKFKWPERQPTTVRFESPASSEYIPMAWEIEKYRVAYMDEQCVIHYENGGSCAHLQYVIRNAW